MVTTTSSLGQMQDTEQCGTDLGRPLGDARAGDTAVRPQEQHRFAVTVEPLLQGPGTVTDHDHVRVIVAGPVQLGLRARRDESGAERLPAVEGLRTQ